MSGRKKKRKEKKIRSSSCCECNIPSVLFLQISAANSVFHTLWTGVCSSFYISSQNLVLPNITNTVSISSEKRNAAQISSSTLLLKPIFTDLESLKYSSEYTRNFLYLKTFFLKIKQVIHVEISLWCHIYKNNWIVFDEKQLLCASISSHRIIIFHFTKYNGKLFFLQSSIYTCPHFPLLPAYVPTVHH